MALITGGDSDIGRAVAVLFAREGADMAILYLSEHDDAAETKRCVESEGRRCLVICADVKDAKACTDAVEQTAKEFSQLDILVNNAGFQEHAESLEDLSDERFDETFRTNVYGYFHMARAALPHMKRAPRSSIPGRSPGSRAVPICSITPRRKAPSTRSRRHSRKTSSSAVSA